MAPERVVVVGGDAAGMTAAATLRRRRSTDEAAITAFERTPHTSYSLCGVPYWVAGDVASLGDLVVRTPEQHRARDVEVHEDTEVVGLDLDRTTVTVRGPGGERTVPYDQLVLATGSRAIRPDLPGIDAEGVLAVKSLEDGRRVLAAIEDRPRRVVVVGGGYIGLEMAESLRRRGLDVVVVDRAEEPMPLLDAGLGAQVRAAMVRAGIPFHGGAAVEGFETDGGRVRRVVTADAGYDADLVVIGLGVAPETALAKDAGLALGHHGGLLTDVHQRVEGTANVWAAGDCTETVHRVTGHRVHMALGTHAIRQGRVLGDNLAGVQRRFPGVVGTAMTRVGDLEIALTGLGEQAAQAAGFDVVTAQATGNTRAGYFPGAEELTLRLVAERGTGRLLGVQVVGGEGSAKRIDAAAVAVWQALSVEDVQFLDLGYAPPMAPSTEVLLVAAAKAAELVRTAVD